MYITVPAELPDEPEFTATQFDPLYWSKSPVLAVDGSSISFNGSLSASLIDTEPPPLLREIVDPEIDNVCENCKKEDSSVKQNLMMFSYKICNSCNLSKTIFPV